ncbi:hypothetical protein [Methylobacterium sp. R2-1]|uniref:hypothetical protein n=1 Tax=Methylobacterium sp. R2-1 TaxID=2587064 RepID=UPI00161FA4C3|nr:hypothetical protein [Methylobacterium sp. R2-1]MBB2960724.1 hypothetical protein [Methylobacterium sp. R2-1]
MHFTYRKPDSAEDLQQGDILAPTAELKALIEKYHPYYANAKFTGYLVATQSCDLVRRKDGVGAEYIGLCAIKPFTGVLDREIKKYQSSLLVAAEAIGSRSRDRVLMFIERLLNNNHPEYFYLHEDPVHGVAERSCAYLRLAISVRSEHYDVCLSSRRLALELGFQSKLGWLIGNLYSRVGTEDWAPKNKTDSEWKKLLNSILEESVAVIDDKKADAAKKKIKIEDLDGVPSEEIRNRINAVAVRNRKDEVIEIIIDQLLADDVIDKASSEKVKVRLTQNASLASVFK